MNNFLNFIEDDISAKKTLISTLPIKTKTNKKKYNEKIDEFIDRYEEYQACVKKYIETKNKAYSIKDCEKKLDDLTEKLNNLEHIRFVLNPSNTYVEKMGFDILLYEISNYYDFNFNSLNDIINKFLDKFELAGIVLTSMQFDYTCYVYEYMSLFLSIRNTKSNNYDKMAEIFEKIYWVNPEIIGHIELNFRKLINVYAKKFNTYIDRLKREVMLENGIKNYTDCLEKLKDAYNDLEDAGNEDIYDIISLSKLGEIDINNYFEDSKVRIATYETFAIDPLNLKDETEMSKFYGVLKKLKANVEEYENFVKFLPLIESFKLQYSKLLNEKSSVKELKSIETQIRNKELKLQKTNKKIFDSRNGKQKSNFEGELRQFKIESIKQAKELYDLYRELEHEYFKTKVSNIMSNNLTILEVLNLYYSFDYFKKVDIKKVFNITNYKDLIENSERFDLFAMKPTNVIIGGINIFDKIDVTQIIINKYRLNNINLTSEALTIDEIPILLEKINFILRINEIEKTSTTVEKIWFMTQVNKIMPEKSK